jgi:hypothetical protein
MGLQKNSCLEQAFFAVLSGPLRLPDMGRTPDIMSKNPTLQSQGVELSV